jgi:hypothetical protein
MVTPARSEPRDQVRAQRHYSGRTAPALETQAREFRPLCLVLQELRTGRQRPRRRPAARRAFQAANPCPAARLPTGFCASYMVDHIVH